MSDSAKGEDDEFSTKPKMVLFLHNATKLKLTHDNKLVMISPDWNQEVEIGYCTLTVPTDLQEILQNFSSRLV